MTGAGEAGLRRTLGLRNGVMLVVGNVVGAGIFTTSGFLADQVRDPVVFIAIWVAGGLVTLCGALTYAELGAMFPRAGGDYQFLKEAYGPWAGFMLGWLSFWIITPGSIAALSIAFVEYVPGLPDEPAARKLGALAVIAAVSALNRLGVRIAGNTQDAITIGGVLLLAAMGAAGLALGHGDPSNLATGATGGLSLPAGGAFIAVIFTYSGWFAAAYVGGEVVRPERNVPLSLALGTGAVTLLYVTMNTIYIYAVPLEEMAGQENVAQLAFGRLFAGRGAFAVAAAILLAIASCINATVMTGARVCYAMARDGMAPARLGAVHPVRGTPSAAILVQAIVAGALVAAGTFDQLLSCVVFAMVLGSVATAAAVYVLRVKKKGTRRPYRTLGYPVIPAIFIGAYIWVAWAIFADRTEIAIIGLILAGSGLPFYFAWKKWATPRR